MPTSALPMTLVIYVLAAFFELAGSFALWSVLRLGKSPIWLIPGTVALFAFAAILTKIEMAAAGRTYAAYGGIYIVGSLLWLWLIEGRHPDHWDLAGAALTIGGAMVILLGPRSSM